jgi:hypothetical protein
MAGAYSRRGAAADPRRVATLWHDAAVFNLPGEPWRLAISDLTRGLSR